MSKQPTAEIYEQIVQRLISKGYSIKTKASKAKLYKALEAADFKVKLDGVEYTVYASRILALMYDFLNDSKAIEL